MYDPRHRAGGRRRYDVRATRIRGEEQQQQLVHFVCVGQQSNACNVCVADHCTVAPFSRRNAGGAQMGLPSLAAQRGQPPPTAHLMHGQTAKCMVVPPRGMGTCAHNCKQSRKRRASGGGGAAGGQPASATLLESPVAARVRYVGRNPPMQPPPSPAAGPPEATHIKSGWTWVEAPHAGRNLP